MLKALKTFEWECDGCKFSHRVETSSAHLPPLPKNWNLSKNGLKEFCARCSYYESCLGKRSGDVAEAILMITYAYEVAQAKEGEPKPKKDPRTPAKDFVILWSVEGTPDGLVTRVEYE